MHLQNKIKRRLLVSGITIALLGTGPFVPGQMVAAYGWESVLAAKVIPVPSLPSIDLNPLKMAGKLLGLVSDSQKGVKEGKKVDSNYKFKATKVVNGGQTIKKSLANSDKDENVVLVQKKGKANLKGATLTKSGAASSLEKSLGRGQNAALLVAPYSKAEVKNTLIKTNGTGASGLVASGKESQVKGQDVIINTVGTYSRGINVAYKGRVTIDGGQINTSGNYSPALAIDREEGQLQIRHMNLQTSGVASPLVYSTDEVELEQVKGQSNTQLAMIEGASEVKIINSQIVGNGGFVLYDSELGLAKSGTSKLMIQGGRIDVKGAEPLIEVQNTKGQVQLKDTIISMPHSELLATVGQGQWAGKGSSELELKAENENLAGTIVAEPKSKVQVALKASTLTGALNPTKEAKKMELSLDNKSTWNVTGDSYITKLDNEDSTNSNIHTNGYKVVIGTQTL